MTTPQARKFARERIAALSPIRQGDPDFVKVREAFAKLWYSKAAMVADRREDRWLAEGLLMLAGPSQL